MVFIFLGVMMITAWREFASVILPIGLGILVLSIFLILWEGTPKGRIKGLKKK
jgi:hypothetical protein